MFHNSPDELHTSARPSSSRHMQPVTFRQLWSNSQTKSQRSLFAARLLSHREECRRQSEKRNGKLADGQRWSLRFKLECCFGLLLLLRLQFVVAAESKRNENKHRGRADPIRVEVAIVVLVVVVVLLLLLYWHAMRCDAFACKPFLCFMAYFYFSPVRLGLVELGQLKWGAQ